MNARRPVSIVCVRMVAAAVSVAIPARAAVIYVKADAAPGGDGTTWANAYTDVQPALAAAVAGDEIWVAAGTYKPDYDVNTATHTGDRTATFQLTSGVKVYGGFPGLPGQEDNFEVRDWEANVTTLSGDLNGDDAPNWLNRADNSFRLVVSSGNESSTRLDGFTVSGGQADGASPYDRGGGVKCYASSITIANCIFRLNRAVRSAGALRIEGGGSPTIKDCEFTANYSGYEGASNSGDGGAIAISYCTTVLLVGCKFVENTASWNAGAIYSYSSSPVCVNCEFRQNQASHWGGAILFHETCYPKVLGCAFIENTGASGAGAVHIYEDSQAWLVNSSFWGNRTGGTRGGGVLKEEGCLLYLYNCILWGNTNKSGGSGQDVQVYPNTPSSVFVHFCCVQNGTGFVESGPGNIVNDPLFVKTEDGNLRLAPGSPCVDAGNSSLVLADIADLDGDGVTTGEKTPLDADRNPRFVNDPAPDTGTDGETGLPVVDMGAYEGPKQGFVFKLGGTWTPGPIRVREGAPAGQCPTFTIELNENPNTTITASVILLSGDADIAIVGGPLTLVFTPEDWNQPRQVCLTAAEDSDALEGEVVLEVSAAGIRTRQIIAKESDNELSTGRFYVDAGRPPGGNGLTWATALTSVQDAMDGTEVMEIWVAEGVYTPSRLEVPGQPRTSSYKLPHGVSLYGGFPVGGGDGTFQARDPQRYVSTLSGDLNGNDAPGAAIDDPSRQDNAYHVVTVVDAGAGNNAVLDGFAITAGTAHGGEGYTDDGGGIIVVSGTPTIIACTITGNAAWANGGGARVIAGGPTFTDCTFSNNKAAGSADASGGGLYGAGSISLLRCVFVGNEASMDGGGVYAGSTASIVDCDFIANAARYAGGLRNAGNAPKSIVGCRFLRNTATYAGGGAGIWNFESSPVIERCRFISNSNGKFGGGILNQQHQGITAPQIRNCVFIGNSATDYGGAISNIYNCNVTVTNCTIVGNYLTSTIAWARTGGVESDNSQATSCSLTNCILWANYSMHGRDQTAQVSGKVTPSHCVIQGSALALDPLLTPDGHLRAGSPCIGQGTSAGAPATDWDGEERPAETPVDIGADQFLDDDSDGLPNWWEMAAGLDPANADSDTNGVRDDKEDLDADSVTNLDEYEVFSSNPVGVPIIVDADAPGDPLEDGTPEHPFDSIQEALSVAEDGGTVLVRSGVYSGDGNRNLDYAFKGVVVVGQDGAANTTIDCGGISRAVRVGSQQPNVAGSRQDGHAGLVGFTVTGGVADYGGGVYLNRRFCLKDCIFAGNQATVRGGDMYSPAGFRTIDSLRLGVNKAPVDDAGLIDGTHVYLLDAFTIAGGVVESRAALWEGFPGTIEILPGGTFKAGYDTIVRGSIIGTGTIDIDPGQQMTVEGSACIDLRAEGSGEPCGPGGVPGGWIVIDGTLSVRENSQVRNANMDVRQAQIKEGSDIQYNDIFMLDMIASGGQFFVEGNATVANNAITSVGDRYLDLDPSPTEAQHPNIDQNVIRVQIETNPALAQGTLLELRAKDYECESGGVNPDCRSGAWPCPVSDRMDDEFADDQAQNWVLESLEIKPGAKLNLSNRAGFVFRTDTAHAETVYVETLRLHPNAILNTALQALYYEQLVLVDAGGGETMWTGGGPPYPETFSNGAKIVDVPLLGFSLGIVAFNDTTEWPFNEFDIRVRKRLRDSGDQQPQPPGLPLEGAIERLPDARDPVTHDGVMEMKTRAEGRQSASSVAAKGSFARAGDEDIVIAFEYLFRENPAAEIVVKLSDKQDVGERSFEVARVRMPESGRPGSIGSGEFAVFCAQFPRVIPTPPCTLPAEECVLNFTRGTYVEVELVASRDGQDNPVPSTVWIDNLDPQVICGSECASYDGIEDVSEADFLLLLAHYGRSLGSLDSSHSCLDSKVSRDHYVDLGDLLGWDTLFEGSLNACGGVRVAAAKLGETVTPLGSEAGEVAATSRSYPGEVAAASRSYAGDVTLPKNGFIVTGKGANAVGEGLYDRLFPVHATGASTGGALPPAGGEYSGANGRLIRDNKGGVYQLHGTQGLIRLSDGQVMIPPPSDPLPTFDHDGNGATPVATVYVGVRELSGGEFAGVPTADAAVRVVGTETYAYVVPVLVSVPAVGDTPAHSYTAAARLKLSADPAHPENYTVERLYGGDPYEDPLVNADPPWASEYYPYSPREIELDRSGAYVFILSDFSLNDNDWLLIYDEDTGVKEWENRFSELASDLKGPTVLLASATADKLYVAASADGPAEGAYLYRLAFDPAGPSVSADGKVQITGMRQVTAVCERPGDTSVYVAGFLPPDIPEELSRTDAEYWYWFSSDSPIRTTPLWATAPGGDSVWLASSTQGIPSHEMTGSAPEPAGNLALPISAVFVPCSDLDQDGDADLADFTVFQGCFNGPNRTPKLVGCTPSDFDADADVDLADFAVFQSCFNGPNRPAKCQ